MLVDVDQIIETMKDVAQRAWSQGDNVETQIQAYNDGQPIFFCMPSDADRDKWHAAMGLIGSAVPCDALVFLSDTYAVKARRKEGVSDEEAASTPMLKRDGTPWETGQMQYAWLNDTEDKQDLTEQLLISMVDRLGNATSAMIKYERHGDGVLWTGVERYEEGDGTNHQAEGGLIDAARSAMTGPTMAQTMKDSGVLGVFDFDVHEAGIRTMAVAAKVLLTQFDYAVALAATSEEDAKIIADSMEKGLEGLDFDE